MRDFQFAEAPATRIPRHSRSTVVIAAALHVVVFAAILGIKTHPKRVSSIGSIMPTGIAAYVPGPIGTAGTSAPKPEPAQPRKTALTTKMAKEVPKDDQSDAGPSPGQAGVAGGGQPGGGPVRLGSGGTLTLIKKVQPNYPAVMLSARKPGLVVLDAIIHPDGSIGDIKVLQSTNDAFARAAVDAVKQWKYTAPGFEGILTVTVNFTLTG